MRRRTWICLVCVCVAWFQWDRCMMRRVFGCRSWLASTAAEGAVFSKMMSVSWLAPHINLVDRPCVAPIFDYSRT